MQMNCIQQCYPEISLNVGFGDECPSTTQASKWVKWQLITASATPT